MFFLIEDKCLKNKIDNAHTFLGFDCGFFVDKIGLYGGLDIFWNDDVIVYLLGYSSSHIDSLYFFSKSVPFCFTSIYGNSKMDLRSFSGIFYVVCMFCLTYLRLLWVILLRFCFWM